MTYCNRMTKAMSACRNVVGVFCFPRKHPPAYRNNLPFHFSFLIPNPPVVARQSHSSLKLSPSTQTSPLPIQNSSPISSHVSSQSRTESSLPYSHAAHGSGYSSRHLL